MDGQALQYDVICVGSCCWDVLGICTEYPQLDEKKPLEELVEQGGGQAATAAACIATLGGDVAFVGRIGDDVYGHNIAEAFRQAGVDISWGLEVVAGARSQFAFCVAEHGTGRRAIFWLPPTTGQMDPDRLPWERFQQARVVLVDGHHCRAAARIAEWCRGRSIPVVADLERPREGLDRVLELADFPILPQDFAIAYTAATDAEEACRRLNERARGTVIVTMGVSGSVMYDGRRFHHQPAFQVEPVVDTTGAGDVYHGAFAYAISLQMSATDAMRFASAAAALSCRGLGGRAALPSFEEVARLLDRGERPV